MIRFFFCYTIFVLCSFGCRQDTPNTDSNASSSSEATVNEHKLILNQLNRRQATDARITGVRYQDGSFQFDLDNFELGQPTPGIQILPCPQLEQGQHIRFLFNDGPAEVKTSSEFMRPMPDGQHHFAIFLTSSIGESIKSAQAARVGLVTIQNGNIAAMENISQPMIFLNLTDEPIPQPTSEEGFLLDFYVVNAALGRDYAIKIELGTKEATINNWQPYTISELSVG
ncbi:MAG: hypothetical protein AAF544_11185, partial [Bacteroidota bacterium]